MFILHTKKGFPAEKTKYPCNPAKDFKQLQAKSLAQLCTEITNYCQSHACTQSEQNVFTSGN